MAYRRATLEVEKGEQTEAPWTMSGLTNRYHITQNESWPQELLEHFNTEFDAISISSPDGRQVAIIPLDESTRQNAHLIEKAPEMLALLEELLERLEFDEWISDAFVSRVRDIVRQAT